MVETQHAELADPAVILERGQRWRVVGSDSPLYVHRVVSDGQRVIVELSAELPR